MKRFYAQYKDELDKLKHGSLLSAYIWKAILAQISFSYLFQLGQSMWKVRSLNITLDSYKSELPVEPYKQSYSGKTIGACTIVTLVLSACSSIPAGSNNTARMMEPTNVPVHFDAASYTDFDDYIQKTKQHLSAFKVYFQEEEADSELTAAMPFKRYPTEQCKTAERSSLGIVLIHGLSDVPAIMSDLADAYADRCFTVYSILLPGHGARSSELVNVTANDWLAAAQFAVEKLSEKVDKVYVGGYSLGGLIAFKTALDNKRVAGVFGFSPALSLHRPGLLNQTIWLRKIFDWLDKDPQDDAWRLEAMPFNALAETQILSNTVQKELSIRPLQTPVFIAHSQDDAVVDAIANQNLFNSFMPNSRNRIVDYTANVSTNEAIRWPRLIQKSSVLLDQKILSYSHQAIHVAPDNDRYGAKGVLRNCSVNAGNQDISTMKACYSDEIPYRGEVFGNATARYKEYGVDGVVRLTYNPQFNELLEMIDEFLLSLGNLEGSARS